jgi:hypothetical protein
MKDCAEKNFALLGWETGCVQTKIGVDRPVAIKIKGYDAFEWETTPLGDPVPSFDSSESEEENEKPKLNANTQIAAASPSSKDKVKPSPSRKNVEHSLLSSSEDEADNSGSESDLECEDDDMFQVDALDDTKEQELESGLSPPEGFMFQDKPTELKFSQWRNSPVYWKIPLTAATGKPGWIVSHIASGPPDPISVTRGVTMTLRCRKKVDTNTPPNLYSNSPVAVTLNLKNYGFSWYLLRTKNRDSEVT